MSIQVYWEDSSHMIVRWTFAEMWTWADVQAALHKTVALRSHVEHPVILLIDQSAAVNMLSSGAVTHLTHLVQSDVTARRLLVFVTPFEFYHQVMRVILNGFPDLARKTFVLRTTQEADRLLEAYRDPRNRRARTG
ncbi:MAG: hypothetical protein SF162_09290 [bacterium]|nr:hypothetical protein [bacterium]